MKTETILLMLVAGAAVYFFATRQAAAAGGTGQGGGNTTIVVQPDKPGFFETIGQLADRAKEAFGFGDDEGDEMDYASPSDLDRLLSGQ